MFVSSAHRMASDLGFDGSSLPAHTRIAHKHDGAAPPGGAGCRGVCVWGGADMTASVRRRCSSLATRARAAWIRLGVCATKTTSALAPRAAVCAHRHRQGRGRNGEEDCGGSRLTERRPCPCPRGVGGWGGLKPGCAAACAPNFQCPGGTTCGDCFPGYQATGSVCQRTSLRGWPSSGGAVQGVGGR